MSRKAAVPLKIAVLQRVVAQQITDPAEQAALDKFRKGEKRKQGQKAKMNRNGAKSASASVAKKRG